MYEDLQCTIGKKEIVLLTKEKLVRWRFCQFSFLIVGVGNNNEDDALQKIVLLTNVGLSQQNVDTCLRVTLRGQTHHKRVDLLFESILIRAYCEHMKNQREGTEVPLSTFSLG